MDIEILGDLLDGFDALERFERYAGLEFGVVSSAFAFHFVCVEFGLQPDPPHHNHSLATGPIFWGRLTRLSLSIPSLESRLVVSFSPRKIHECFKTA